MTLLGLLRVLADTGAGLAPSPTGGLRWDARPDAKTPEVRAAIVAHKAALRRLIDPTNLRIRLYLPATVTIDPVMATVLAHLSEERAAFTEPERHAWESAVAALMVAEQPRWFADLWAIEEVIGKRSANPVRAEAA